MIYYDRNGNEISAQQFFDIFGEVMVITSDADVWEVASFKEALPSNTLVVKVLDKEGRPMPGVPVAWWWPDVDKAQDRVWDEVAGRWCVRGITNDMGDAGFGMGEGAYYWPDKGQSGPHHVWMFGQNTPWVQGLGMVAATNHLHPDMTIKVLDEKPPVPPPDDCPVEEVLALCKQIMADLEAAWDKVEQIQALFHE